MAEPLRFMVAVDCEGVACVVGAPGGSLNDSPNLAFATLQATREADAAVRACFDAGAGQVIVWDAHGSSVNLDYDLLDPRCDIALGVGFPRRWPGMDETFAGVLFIGYHAMDSTEDAVIAHSFSSAAYQEIRIDGELVGELAIDAAVAGARGVPPLFVASDDKGAAEAARFFPGIETVATKTACGWNAAVSKHPRRAVEEIYAGVRRAISNRAAMQPYRLDGPRELTIRYKRLEAAQAASRPPATGERLDAYTVRWRLASLDERF